LPEAAFSLCLKGRLGGQDAQLTIRGATYQEFAANVDAVRGLLDALAAPSALCAGANPGRHPEPEGWCVMHGLPMKLNHGMDGHRWYSHRTDEGWCKGK
jgi:hypothetical protein